MATTSLVKGGDYPGYLEEKEGSLRSIEEFIEGLEAQLIAARDTRQTILKDIALFKASRAPIAKVPLDLLPLIFEMLCSNPFVRNRTVALVCKKWYNIVWNSARFWDHIAIRPTWEVNKLGPIHRFVQLCHQKTNERPLDVVMDFSAIMPYSAYLGKILDQDLDRFNFTRFWMTRGFFAREERRGGYEELSYPYQRQYDEIAEEFVKKIVQRDQIHINRWRSLHVRLPQYWHADRESDAARAFLRGMYPDMKGLVEITIKGSMGNGKSRIGIPTVLPHIRRLTTNQDIDFDQGKFNHAIVEYLCLSNFHASGHFICTAQSKFVALTTLVLGCSKDWRSLGLVSLGIISLPRLLSLTIIGEFQATMEQMDAPNLASLHLDASFTYSNQTFTCPTSPLFSSVTSLVIKGTATMTRQEVSFEELYKALKQSPALVTLKVEKGASGDNDNVKKLLEEVREAGFPLLYLKQIIVVQTNLLWHSDILTQDKALLTVLEIADLGAETVN